MTGNARSSGYDKQPDQWYVEPRRAIDELLDIEKFHGSILDPCCGAGNIPAACISRGMNASGFDIVDRGYGQVADFLRCSGTSASNIVCNPPFNLAVDFVLHGMKLIDGKIVVLQRTSWLEGERRYQQLFRRNHLLRIWQFRSRISMPPGDSKVEAKNGSVAFAWYVFARDFRSSPTLGWLP